MRAGGKSHARAGNRAPTVYTHARRAPAVRIDRGKRLAGKDRRGHAPLQLQSIEEEREERGKRGGRRDPARGPGIRRLHASTACCSARPPHTSMACSSTRPPIEASHYSSAPPTTAALPSIDSWLAGCFLCSASVGEPFLHVSKEQRYIFYTSLPFFALPLLMPFCTCCWLLCSSSAYAVFYLLLAACARLLCATATSGSVQRAHCSVLLCI